MTTLELCKTHKIILSGNTKLRIYSNSEIRTESISFDWLRDGRLCLLVLWAPLILIWCMRTVINYEPIVSISACPQASRVIITEQKSPIFTPALQALQHAALQTAECQSVFIRKHVIMIELNSSKLYTLFTLNRVTRLDKWTQTSLETIHSL